MYLTVFGESSLRMIVDVEGDVSAMVPLYRVVVVFSTISAFAETASTSAADIVRITLRMGHLLCLSSTTLAREHCLLARWAAPTWWILEKSRGARRTTPILEVERAEAAKSCAGAIFPRSCVHMACGANE